MDVTFITGNRHKVKYFSELVGMDIKNHPVDLEEIQSLDLEEIVIHKARQAYAQLLSPVVVEDTSLVINSLGKLPGPFIKWFLKELSMEKICRIADISIDRSVMASAAFAYFDGQILKVIKGELGGTIPNNPRGDAGFGWNPLFIPKGENRTLGEMDDATFKKFYVQIKPFAEVKEFLASIDKT